MTVPSIHRRLLAWLLGALATGAVLVGVMTYGLALDEMNEEFDEELKQVALTVLGQADNVARALPVRRSPDDLEGYAFVTQVWSLHGELLSSSDGSVDIPFSGSQGYTTLTTRTGRWRIYTDRSESRLIQAAQLLRVREKFAAEVALKAVIPGLLGAPVIAVLLGVALRKGLAPLTVATRELSGRSPTSLEPIATERLPEELRPLTDSVNALMERLARAMAAQQRLVDETAHQLRTPLTALRLQVETLAVAAESAARQPVAADALAGIDRATRVVEQLLTLARAGSDVPVPSGPVDLGQLARDSVAGFAASAVRRNIDLGADIRDEGELQVQGRAGQLKVLLDNLVDNALRYTEPGGRVDVQVGRVDDGAGVELAVVDSGPGIPTQERERIFTRFYRGSTSQGLGREGTGLGLSIVKTSADGHGARISISDGFPGSDALGLRIALRFAAYHFNFPTSLPT
jgi:two-component system OmpR family sensor kinase